MLYVPMTVILVLIAVAVSQPPNQTSLAILRSMNIDSIPFAEVASVVMLSVLLMGVYYIRYPEAERCTALKAFVAQNLSPLLDEPLTNVLGAAEEPRPCFLGLVFVIVSFLGTLSALFWMYKSPTCIQHPHVETCTWLGFRFPCLHGWDHSSKELSQFVVLGHSVAAVVMTFIGVCHFSRARSTEDTMTMTYAAYCVATAWFAIVRATFEIGPPLVFLAAVHNVFEWCVLVQLSFEDQSKQRAMMARGSVWPLLVLAFAMGLALAGVAPDSSVIAVLTVEQFAGISLDFALLVGFADMFRHHGGMFALPFLGSFLHVGGTILPLVLGNFIITTHSPSTFMNELLIYVCTPLSHLLHFHWTHAYDMHVERVAVRPLLPAFRTSYGRHFGYLFVGLLMGIVPLFCLPVMRPSCTPPHAITGMATASVWPGLGDAFKHRVASKGLLENARAAPGNVVYSLLQNIDNPDEFRFVETWDSRDSLLKWMSGFPQELFGEDGDKYLKNMVVGGKLQMTHTVRNEHAGLPAAYMQADLPTTPSGGVQATFKTSCEKMWNVIGDWGNCEWVIGCKEAVVEINDPKMRRLTMPTVELAERLLDMKDHSLAYTITEPTEFYPYTGNLTLVSAGTGCHLTYHFQTGIGSRMTVPGVLADFHEHRIPKLHELFG